MIPKTIYYFWSIHDTKKRDTKACLSSVENYNPDYEFIEINEEHDIFKAALKNRFFSECLQRKLWAFCADYIRVIALYNLGGIYIDTDIQSYKSFDNNLLQHKCFVPLQSETDVEPAVLGAQKNNPFLKKILDFYETDIWHSPLYKIPAIFAKCIKDSYGITNYPAKTSQEIIELDELTIYPEEFFIPYRYAEKFNYSQHITNNTYTAHHWGGSWKNSRELFFVQAKHRNIILKQSRFLARIYDFLHNRQLI